MSAQPKPCPFCGGAAKRTEERLDERFAYANHVRYTCTTCGCSKGAMGDTSKPGHANNSTTGARALSAWNQRAQAGQAGPHEGGAA